MPREIAKGVFVSGWAELVGRMLTSTGWKPALPFYLRSVAVW